MSSKIIPEDVIVDKHDIELVMTQTACSKEIAIKYLKENNNNLTKTIFNITNS